VQEIFKLYVTFVLMNAKLSMEIEFRPMVPSDWTFVAEIYLQGIRSGNATFETELPSWEKWDSSHIKSCRIVAVAGNTVLGWAALVPVSTRKVYSGVAEVSVYVAERFTGKSVGKKLLGQLVTESEKEGFWTLQASIFPENLASLKIQSDLGFRKVGYREKIAMMNGKWRDTILLERRNNIA
jgi:L-amino acid N-acyltransferase YncA